MLTVRGADVLVSLQPASASKRPSAALTEKAFGCGGKLTLYGTQLITSGLVVLVTPAARLAFTVTITRATWYTPAIVTALWYLIFRRGGGRKWHGLVLPPQSGRLSSQGRRPYGLPPSPVCVV